VGQGLPPSAALQTKLKRLLDTDRDLDHKPRSRDPALANYAFYSGEPPGRGSVRVGEEQCRLGQLLS
jgi:hypothetical protein